MGGGGAHGQTLEGPRAPLGGGGQLSIGGARAPPKRYKVTPLMTDAAGLQARTIVAPQSRDFAFELTEPSKSLVFS